ncbi:hypothetical protein BGP77_00070 [Saccharospirillum sp. MSK14-1]|uniref:hypothetical protein n=1 Tax=Saccharospirillum sp. MSK14-1 TaxID=1897632 RepID=UPI000D390E2D|nr:hypothetical protein [Saccharospirillum sp. MSK14-1]PTY35765.1 hypothetical protein BGP77_00070 [Saccharospirillum sp. MSK14-1]
MLRRLCQGVLLSIFVLSLVVPAANHPMTPQAASEAPCPNVDMTRHCPDGVNLDCLAGCLAATPALSLTTQLGLAPMPQVVDQPRVLASDTGFHRRLERPPSLSV